MLTLGIYQNSRNNEEKSQGGSQYNGKKSKNKYTVFSRAKVYFSQAKVYAKNRLLLEKNRLKLEKIRLSSRKQTLAREKLDFNLRK